MDNKRPWASKTLWTSLIVAAAPLYPPIGQFVAENPDAAGAIVAIIFATLRVLSSQGVKI
jgi:hypothetical protein